MYADAACRGARAPTSRGLSHRVQRSLLHVRGALDTDNTDPGCDYRSAN